MARPGRPERNRAAQSFRQLRRFHHVINSNKVFGTHRPSTIERLPIYALRPPYIWGIEKRFCRFQVGRVEAFGKAIVDGLKQRERLRAPVLTAPQAREARGCAQLPPE